MGRGQLSPEASLSPAGAGPQGPGARGRFLGADMLIARRQVLAAGKAPSPLSGEPAGFPLAAMSTQARH